MQRGWIWMNERHYGVAMLGWVPTHSSEIESYSANGGLHQMTSSKIQKLFLFSWGKPMFLLHRITYLSKLLNQGQGSWYYDKNTKLQENNWSVCSKFDPLTPAHCNCENALSFITNLKIHAICAQKKLVLKNISPFE